MSSDGVEKSAILLMSLGEEAAASVFKHLGPREVQKLGQAMAAMKNVTKESIGGVLGEFHKVAGERTSVGIDSDEYVRTVLTKALGNDKAAGLINRILHSGDTSGIEGLKWMDAASVAELIKNEHPQIIATILVHLDRDQASEVLGHFSEGLRNDVIVAMRRITSLRKPSLKCWDISARACAMT